MNKRKIFLFLAPACVVLVLIIGIVVYPVESIAAAKEGIDIWLDILVPSLLPFIVGASLIVDLKVIDIIGFIINPITKFIFNVSGKSALVFAISTISGYPVGAKLASEFRAKEQISQTEAQRLVSFCSTSGPLFIIGSVGTGMFKDSALGYLMIICHYLGTITVGLLFRNYGWESLSKSKKSLRENIRSVVETKSSNGNFFVMFGNAVYNGVNTLLTIGGFVIIFSVVFRVLFLFNIIQIVSFIIHIPLSLFGITEELCNAFISGFFEITIGCNKISQVMSNSEHIKATLASFLIGFSGLSILSQCCTFLAKTDINIKLYISSKFLHGLFAAIFLFLLYPIFKTSVVTSTFNFSSSIIFDNVLWVSYMNYYRIVIYVTITTYIISAILKMDKFRYFSKYFYRKFNKIN
ncbi:MAG: sporulation integral membrane protein YlbJ [Clostridioides difficile]|nr:sporulation integral membrane protein YlbJ [Clostridioides sp.]MBS5786483.1 sporulation integral membrane protein YlbJ [Clostridioides difficile]